VEADCIPVTCLSHALITTDVPPKVYHPTWQGHDRLYTTSAISGLLLTALVY
jgi:hypothetical protein